MKKLASISRKDALTEMESIEQGYVHQKKIDLVRMKNENMGKFSRWLQLNYGLSRSCQEFRTDVLIKENANSTNL